MHRAFVVIAVIAMAALAWIADRLLWEAQIRFGTYAGGEGTREVLLLADRVPRLLLLLILGALLVAAWRGLMGRPLATVLLLVGGLISVVPLVGIGFSADAPWRLALEMVFPYFFLGWTVTGMAVIGAVGLLRWRGSLTSIRPLPAWSRVVLAVGVMALAIPLDALLDGAFLELAHSGDAALPFFALDLAIRLSVLATLAALALLTLKGARDRLAGLALTVVGIVPFIGLAVLGVIGDPPGALLRGEGGVPVAGFAMRWLAGGIVILGAWELVRSVPRSRPEPTVREAPAAYP